MSVDRDVSSLMKKLQNLPPHLQLYANRFISKTPLNAVHSDLSFACDKHPSDPIEPKTMKTESIGGMKKGFLSSKSKQGKVKSAAVQNDENKDPNPQPPVPKTNSLKNRKSKKSDIIKSAELARSTPAYQTFEEEKEIVFFDQLIEAMERLAECIKVHGLYEVKAQVAWFNAGELIDPYLLNKNVPCRLFTLFHVQDDETTKQKSSELYFAARFIDKFFHNFHEVISAPSKDYRGFTAFMLFLRTTDCGPSSYANKVNFMVLQNDPVAGAAFDFTFGFHHINCIQLLLCILACMKVGEWNLKTRLDTEYQPFSLKDDYLQLASKFTNKNIKRDMDEIERIGTLVERKFA